MEGDDIVKKIMDIDIRFEKLDNSSIMHYDKFDEVKAELFNIQSMCTT
jgi:hypothetical protein